MFENLDNLIKGFATPTACLSLWVCLKEIHIKFTDVVNVQICPCGPLTRLKFAQKQGHESNADTEKAEAAKDGVLSAGAAEATWSGRVAPWVDSLAARIGSGPS